MAGNVYVVCAIDTEGPIDDPHKPDILSNWGRVDNLICKITSDQYRLSYPDSYGRGLVFSWFILHLTGFKTNPFNRAMGYHSVYDHYLSVHGETIEKYGDGIYWHYHQPAPSGVGNEWCRDWTHCTEYYNILAHMVLDRRFFPNCFRAGGRIQDDDLSNWIEQWIPFDFSNNSGNVNWDKLESDGKRLREVCDWTRASQDWFPYHPSEKDYQAIGEQKRLLFRCPDLDSAVHRLTEDEIKKAFVTAQSGQDAVLAFFEHDRRLNVIEKIQEACEIISHIAVKYPEVKWKYSNALDSTRPFWQKSVLKAAPEFTVKLREEKRLFITANQAIFGYSPFVCGIMNEKHKTFPLHKIGHLKWISDEISIENLDLLGVAANNDQGTAGIGLWEYNILTQQLEKKIHI